LTDFVWHECGNVRVVSILLTSKLGSPLAAKSPPKPVALSAPTAAQIESGELPFAALSPQCSDGLVSDNLLPMRSRDPYNFTSGNFAAVRAFNS
jgi:hypothetical protein